MKKGNKIWHFLLLIWIIILFLRFELLINTYKLIFAWIILLFNNSGIALSQLNFALFDSMFSGVFFIVIPILFYIYRKKLGFLYGKISPAAFFLILLITCFLFAPLVSNKNPDFYKNIGTTKLLPPLSSVQILHFKNKSDNQSENNSGKFFYLRDKVVNKSFDENIQYIDSISIGDKITYYQNEITKEADKKNLVMQEENPYITKQIFLLGSDQFGRDVLTRIIYGARISLTVGFGSVIISLFIGLTFGFLAGYIGGFLDAVFSRFTDMLLSFPIIFLVILILALFGNSLLSVIVVLGFSGWMSLFKIVKTEVLSIKEKNYFVSSKLLGLTKKQLLLREVLPVIIVPVIVNIIFQFGNVIIAESALSYLGLGLGNNYPSWGAMIQSGQEYLSLAWWMIFFPGITLIFTLLAANSFGSSLSRKLNPRLQND
jgi:peptide/nickel transport system permease protein